MDDQKLQTSQPTTQQKSSVQINQFLQTQLSEMSQFKQSPSLQSPSSTQYSSNRQQPTQNTMNPPSSKPKTAEEKLLNTQQNAKHLQILKQLMSLPENSRCADCGKKDPSWASINLGIFICLSCSGIHRSLGTHISKVRSCTLDTWEQSHIEFMQSMGNARAKAIWEANVPSNYPIPTESDPQSVIKKWIVAKYENCEFKAKERMQSKESSEIPNKSSTPKQTQANYNLGINFQTQCSPVQYGYGQPTGGFQQNTRFQTSNYNLQTNSYPNSTFQQQSYGYQNSTFQQQTTNKIFGILFPFL